MKFGFVVMTRSLIFKILYALGVFHFLRKQKKGHITVISLHRISDKKDYFFQPLSPATFERLVVYCKKYYEVVSFSEITRETRKPKLIFSFDDGYYDFMEHAIPVLHKYGLPCNHNFVNASLNGNHIIWTQQLNDIFNFLRGNNITDDDIIRSFGVKFENNWNVYYISFFREMLKTGAGDRKKIIDSLTGKYGVVSDYRMMTWDDVKQCSEEYNVEIGCHTYNHESLYSVINEDILKYEIGMAIDEMSAKINRKVEILALPNGQYNDTVLDFIKAKGIKFTLMVGNKVNPEVNIGQTNNIIGRINLIDESYCEMVHRVELFHEKIRKLS